MVKINGQIITNKAICKATINQNWNNSMGEFYPTLSITSINDGNVQYESISLSHISQDPFDLEHNMEVTIDDNMFTQYVIYLAKQDYYREFPVVRKGKVLEVVSGRKVPTGTTGKCFWVGETRFGHSCGIELTNGERVFTSVSNVRVVSLD